MCIDMMCPGSSVLHDDRCVGCCVVYCNRCDELSDEYKCGTCVVLRVMRRVAVGCGTVTKNITSHYAVVNRGEW